MKKVILLVALVLVTTISAVAQPRQFFRAEHPQIKSFLEEQLIPMYNPNSKVVYWQFYNGWTFANHQDETKMIFEGDDIGLANLWSYGTRNTNNLFCHFNVVATQTQILAYYIMQPINSIAGIIEYRIDKYLPEEQDYKTCKEFITKLVESKPDFLEIYNNLSADAEYVVNLGYSANEFAGQDTTTLYWSIALVDVVNDDWVVYYCYADAYNLDDIYCYYTSIKENSIATHFAISPNPTSADAVASFGLLESANITLEVCDILGNVLFTITNFYDVGEHFVPLDVSGLANGSYICRMITKGKQIGLVNFVVGK